MNETTTQKPVRRSVAPILKLTPDGADGVLVGSACKNCGVTHLGSPAVCLKCLSADLKPVELSRKGVLHTYTVIWAPPAGWQGPVPYFLGAVGLPEGPDVLAEVIDCPRDALKVGAQMEMVVKVGGKDKDGNEVMVYKWRPTGEKSQ